MRIFTWDLKQAIDRATYDSAYNAWDLAEFLGARGLQDLWRGLFSRNRWVGVCEYPSANLFAAKKESSWRYSIENGTDIAMLDLSGQRCRVAASSRRASSRVAQAN